MDIVISVSTQRIYYDGSWYQTVSAEAKDNYLNIQLVKYEPTGKEPSKL